MAYKPTDTVKTLARRRPSLATLWANRSQYFERAHPILPSSAVTGESLSLTLQARDQCERLVADFRGEFDVDATDPEAAVPLPIVAPLRSSRTTRRREPASALNGSHPEG